MTDLLKSGVRQVLLLYSRKLKISVEMVNRSLIRNAKPYN